MNSYNTDGTCSSEIKFKIEDDILKDVTFIDGCPGSLEGISKLVVGMKVGDVINKCEGIPCRGETSCPDQLARALKEYVSAQG